MRPRQNFIKNYSSQNKFWLKGHRITIAAGQRAAESIERWVDGLSLERTYEVTKPYMHVDAVSVSDEEMMDSRRVHAKELPVTGRVGSFEEIVTVLTAEEAMKEARRCLRCDLS